MNELYPVNKTINFKINPSIYMKMDNKNTGVSIITCTNKKNHMDIILNNYIRQNHLKKELIIILNNNQLKIDNWRNKTNEYIKIYQLDQNISLGECLNFATNKCKYPIIAKFDDDDYYGPKYLTDSIKSFYYTNADIIGKYSTFVYFKKDNILALRNINRDNKYVFRVEGPTLIFKKEILEKIKFKSKNLGEDLTFCKDALKNGLKIYSTNIYHYLYIRNSSKNHTWNISNEYFINNCKFLCKSKNMKKIINSYINVTSPI